MGDSTFLLRIEGKLPFNVSRHHQETMDFALADSTWATVYAVDIEEGITNSGTPMLAVTSRYTVPAEWLAALQENVGDESPDGPRAIKPNTLAFNLLPAAMQEHCNAAADSLSRHWLEAYALIRWRWPTAVDPGSFPTPLYSMLWSNDGIEWNPLRRGLSYSVSGVPQLSLNHVVAEELETLATSQDREPVGREIWHVASQVDPVTAIVLAVTAIEVELKRLVSTMVPEAEWLLVNLPAPPIVRIIEEYLPTLESYTKALSPPDVLVKTLRRAVKQRNDFVHVGPTGDARWLRSSVEESALRSVLDATSDLLWLFDAQRGYTWALDNLSEQTKFDLGLRDSPPEPRDEWVFVVPPEQGRSASTRLSQRRDHRREP